MSAGEIFQASGSRARFLFSNEASWGTVNGSPTWHQMRMIPGETLDQKMATYASTQIRPDRGRNPTVRGSQTPGGSVPFELGPSGWNQILWHLLGGPVTVTNPGTVVASPGTITATPSTTGGILAAQSSHWTYKVTALTAVGETLPSSASTAATTTGSTSKITLTWAAVTGATGYKIYGRTSGSFLFIGSVGGSVTTFIDTGFITPSYAVPGADSSGSTYQHVFAGYTDVPVGFTIEKGYLDAGLFYPFYGCRVGKMSLNLDINKIVTGMFDIESRRAGDPMQTSLLGMGSFDLADDAPFTATQIQLYMTQNTTETQIATSKSIKFDVNNNFQAQAGTVLGSVIRNNLRPGTRITGWTGEFQFTDGEFYQMANRGDNFGMRIFMTNGIYSAEFNMTKCQMLPNNTMPKLKDSNNLTVAVVGEADTDDALGTPTDVTCTLLTPDSTITA